MRALAPAAVARHERGARTHAQRSVSTAPRGRRWADTVVAPAGADCKRGRSRVEARQPWDHPPRLRRSHEPKGDARVQDTPLSLIVMAAGLGSRYGGLKQFESVGPGGARLMDYAIFDALRAGVECLVFVLRPGTQDEFHAACGRDYARRAEVRYAFQDLADVPSGFRVPEQRVKPWGTGHAVLAAAGQVPGAFIAINADDFYGADGFRQLAAFLRQPPCPEPPARHALVAYDLRQTLSAHGSVARGVCDVHPNGLLRGVREHTALVPDGRGAREQHANGRVFSGDEPVSLNLWGFAPSLFDELRVGFARFLATRGSDLKAEFFLPAIVDEAIAAARVEVTVLRTPAQWFGVTYREDREPVSARLHALHAAGEYPERLFP